MDEIKKIELSGGLLDKVAGGAINVFYEVPVNPEYWKYTCRACGNVGIMASWPSACCNCNDTNIAREEYKPGCPD